MNSIPMGRSAIIIGIGPEWTNCPSSGSVKSKLTGIGAAKGITAKINEAGMNDIAGAITKSSLVACAGISSSFTKFLMPSAIGWNSPWGPTRLGPRRSCLNALIRRSAKVASATPNSITENTTVIFIEERRMNPLSSGVTPTLPLQTWFFRTFRGSRTRVPGTRLPPPPSPRRLPRR